MLVPPNTKSMINFLPLEDLTKSKLETNSSEPKMIAAKLLVTPVFGNVGLSTGHAFFL